MTQKFLFNGAVRGVEYSTSPNGLITRYTQRDVLFWSPTLILPNPSSQQELDSFFFLSALRGKKERKDLDFSLAIAPHLGGTVNSWFVIVICLPPHLSHCLYSSLKCDSQWKPFVQDVQAQEEYPGGFSSVRAVETCRGHTGKWKPAHGSHVAWGWRLEWVGRCQQ